MPFGCPGGAGLPAGSPVSQLTLWSHYFARWTEKPTVPYARVRDSLPGAPRIFVYRLPPVLLTIAGRRKVYSMSKGDGLSCGDLDPLCLSHHFLALH